MGRFYSKTPSCITPPQLLPCCNNNETAFFFHPTYKQTHRQHAALLHAAGACIVMETVNFFMLWIDDNTVDHTVGIADAAVLPGYLHGRSLIVWQQDKTLVDMPAFLNGVDISELFHPGLV